MLDFASAVHLALRAREELDNSLVIVPTEAAKAGLTADISDTEYHLRLAEGCISLALAILRDPSGMVQLETLVDTCMKLAIYFGNGEERAEVTFLGGSYVIRRPGRTRAGIFLQAGYAEDFINQRVDDQGNLKPGFEDAWNRDCDKYYPF